MISINIRVYVDLLIIIIYFIFKYGYNIHALKYVEIALKNSAQPQVELLKEKVQSV